MYYVVVLGIARLFLILFLFSVVFFFFFFFFFQAEDGIRDHCVTGVQTCALPILGPASALHAITAQLGRRKIPVQGAEIAMIPKSTVKVDGKAAKQLLELLEALEEMDDVARVSSNFDIDAEAMAAATA